MKDLVMLNKRVFRTSAILISVMLALAACGGGGDSTGNATLAATAAPPAGSINPQVVPLDANFRGKTYTEWVVSFWQWALVLPTGPLPHPFNDCQNRPISASQTGNVWYWSAPDAAPLLCDQTGTVIPGGTAILLTMLDVEASSLDSDPHFNSPTADGQRKIATTFASYISDLFCTIDGVSVTDIPAYRTTTGQFSFTPPANWIFGTNPTNATATSVAAGYFLLLKPLSPGKHEIHYGGTFHIPAGVFGPDAVDVPKDVTLWIRVGD
ncbi:hypothetical protein [Cupriavidus sp. TMH.W2]|uniref:hypothetical protein n=1 Tax=Cupriavidus sp. TMH.W2 TaxID=3434465 RepID=UPI003D76E74E